MDIPTAPPSDFPTTLPSDYLPPPPATEEGPLDVLRGFVQGTIDPALSTARDWVGGLVKEALPILQPPATQAGQGSLGGNLLGGVVDMLNPLPADTSDLLRDVGFLAIPGGKTIRQGLKTPLRVGAGTAGAVLGANLSGESELGAAGASIPGLLFGEAMGGLTKNLGREARQSAADLKNSVKVMNQAMPTNQLPDDMGKLYDKAFGPKDINMKDITLRRYQGMLDKVEDGMWNPERPLVDLPDGSTGASFREAMDFIRTNSSAGARKAPLGEAPKSQRQRAMEVIAVREQVIDALKADPQDAPLANLVQEETKQYFIDLTARRLLRAKGVLNPDTGLWNMRAMQEAFHKELTKEMIPSDVYDLFQKAFLRGAKPPKMDTMGNVGALMRGIYGMGGAVAGTATGHPIMGYHSGLRAAERMAPTNYVGEAVGPSPVSELIRAPLSIGTAQSINSILEGLE